MKTSLEVIPKEESTRKENPFAKKDDSDKVFTNGWKALCQSSFHVKENSNFDKIFQKRNFGGTDLVTSTPVNMLNQNPSKQDKSASPRSK